MLFAYCAVQCWLVWLLDQKPSERPWHFRAARVLCVVGYAALAWFLLTYTPSWK